MRLSITAAMALTVSLVLAACAGTPQATPVAAEATVTSAASPDPTSSVTPDATESASNTREPTEPEAAACEDGPAGTYLDTTWTDNVSDHVGFLYLNDWEDRSGLVNSEAGTLLAEDTLADLGLESDAALKAQFVRHPAGFPNFSVFRFEGTEASSLDLADIYAREAARFAALPDVTELLATEIEECLDSEPALGLELTFSASGDEFYQISFFTQHEGAIYHLQWLDERKGIVELLDEMLGSWHWASGGGAFESDSDDASESGARFVETHLSATVPDVDREEPDRASFATSFSSDADDICVVFLVDVDVPDTLVVTWHHEGAPVFTQDADFNQSDGWAWMCIRTSSGGFDTGDWSVNLEFAGSGEERTDSFSVRD